MRYERTLFTVLFLGVVVLGLDLAWVYHTHQPELYPLECHGDSGLVTHSMDIIGDEITQSADGRWWVISAQSHRPVDVTSHDCTTW